MTQIAGRLTVATLCCALTLAVGACGKEDKPARPAAATGPSRRGSGDRPAAGRAPIAWSATASAPALPALAPPARAASRPAGEGLMRMMAWISRPDPNKPPWRQADPAAMRRKKFHRDTLYRCAHGKGNRKFVSGRLLRYWGRSCTSMLVEELASSQQEEVRAAAAEALGHIGDLRALKPLHTALFDVPAVSRAAAEALDRLDKDWRDRPAAKRRVGQLLDRLRDKRNLTHPRVDFLRMPPARKENDWVVDMLDRDFGAADQGWRGGLTDVRKRIAQARQAVARARPNVIRAAAAGLGHLADRNAVAALTDVLVELHDMPAGHSWLEWRAMESVCDALRQLDADWHAHPPGSEAIAYFQAKLTRPEGATRHWAAMTLSSTRAPRAATDLARAWAKDSDHWSGSFWRGDFKALRSDEYERSRDLPSVGWAGHALMRMGDKRVLPILAKMMDAKRPESASQAAVVFGSVGGDDAVAALTGRVKNASGNHALAMIVALGMTQSRAAVGPLTDIYRAGIGGMTYLQAEGAFDARTRSERNRLLYKHGSRDSAIRSTMQQRGNLGQRARAVAVWALGRLNQKAVGPTLLAAARDQDPGVRAAALWGLRRMKLPDAVPLATAALADRSPALREQAIELLAESGDPRATAPLCAMVKRYDQSAPKRPRKPEFPGQKVVLDKKTFGLIAEALGRMGDPRAIGSLAVALSRGMNDAYYALPRIDMYWPRHAAARQAVPDVVAAMRSDDRYVRMSAIGVLALIGDRKALKPMAELMGKSKMPDLLIWALTMVDPSWRGAGEVKSVAGALIAQVAAKNPKPADDDSPQHDAWWARRFRKLAALRFLGEIGDVRAVRPVLSFFETVSQPPQTRALGDRDLWAGFDIGGERMRRRLVMACAEALGKLQDRSATVALSSALSRGVKAPRLPSHFPLETEDREDHLIALAHALGSLGDRRAGDVLLEALQPPHKDVDVLPGVLAAAALAMGRIGDPRAVPVLIDLLKSPKYRYTAVRTLGKLGDKLAVQPLIRTLRQSGDTAAEALEQIDPTWRKLPAADALTGQIVGELLKDPAKLIEPTKDDRFGSGRPRPPAQTDVLNLLNPQWRSGEVARAGVGQLHRQLTAAQDAKTAVPIVRLLGYMGSATSIGPILEAAARLGGAILKTGVAALGRIDDDWGKTKAAAAMVAKLADVLTRNRDVDIDTDREYGPKHDNLSATLLLGRIESRRATDALLAELRNKSHRGRADYTRKLIVLAAPRLTASDIRALQAELGEPESTMLSNLTVLAEPVPKRAEPKSP